MTAEEFRNTFDLYYNYSSSNQAPGLSSYEVSLFLTRAQNELVKSYHTPRPGGNKYQLGLDDSPKRFIDFSKLYRTVTLTPVAGNTYDSRGKLYRLPDDLFIIMRETFHTASISHAERAIQQEYQVIPLKMDEYSRLMSKPSKDPLRDQVWRIAGNEIGCVEIVPHWGDVNNATNNLIIKYLKQPYPIIVEELRTQNLSINGCDNIGGLKVGSNYTEDSGRNEIVPPCCELPEEIHEEIVIRAVEIAKVTMQGQPGDVLQIGQRAE